MESLEAIDYDLRYLLQLSHDKFWSQVLHDKTLSILLDSYLQHGLRPHEEAWSVPEKVLELLRNIHRRIFMTFLRLSTHKEDRDHHISPEVFGNLIHTHSLFSVPRLLDLCSIYGNSNRQLLEKMIDNVISKQEQYRTDLYSVMNTSLKEALGVLVDRSSRAESFSEAKDLLLYLTDITHSLSSLISVWRPAASIMCRAGLIESLVNCYELSLPILKLKLKENKTKNFPRVYYQLVKENTSTIVHSLLMSCCHGDERKGGAEDQVLASISAIATGKLFYNEFEKHFSLRDVFQSLKGIYPNLDDSQLQYMLAESVSDVLSPPPPLPPAPTTQRSKGKAPSIKESVSYIREMLPHLEEEFIKDCLKEYHYNQEVVIHHILEGTLPPHLLPQEEEATPTEATPLPLEEGQSILEGRLGAYDYDEFDIFRREDVDFSKIHVGKKFESVREVLSDKSHLRYMKGAGLDLINYDEYDDEYDDTYDSHNIGSLDQEENDETFTIKRLNEKGQFSSRGHKWLSEEEGVAESGPAHQPAPPTQPLKLLQRPVTPDKIRKEKTSPSLKNKHQKGGHKRHTDQSKREEGGARNKRAGLQHEDKKPSKAERKEERPADKEPSRSVERQRTYNERHKSSRANHNRKALSDKKRGGAY